jgi:hypothetical protein
MFAGMTTLSDIRDRVRRDLSDSAEVTWPDDQLDRHIAHALSDLSLAIPQELSIDIATTSGSRDISVSSIEGLIDVERIEFPIGEFPPCYPGFASWAQTLTLQLNAPPDGEDARVFYTASHQLDEDGSTLPEQLTDILATGASAYAALEVSAGTANVVNLDPAASERYAAFSRARLTAFRQLLHTYGRKNRVRSRRIYVPA